MKFYYIRRSVSNKIEEKNNKEGTCEHQVKNNYSKATASIVYKQKVVHAIQFYYTILLQ